MHLPNPKNPLHGITLQKILEDLIAFYGFDTLGELIKIKCFMDNPSLKSSLTFLRKTPWAREKVEQLYVKTLPKLAHGEKL
ncbi:VF530 family protein [Flavobacterium sp.]|uniref:VF530 family protein n=1 Tax=Flavobacterium sp. TaxID=239 RepID=UPI00260A7D74|nr:VF530 family protein [Flavobacterium sp.]MDD3003507.1 VF530 family protein [Flavobacterium sp.]